MPINRTRCSAPDPQDDSTLSAFISAFTILNKHDRHAVLAFLDFWRGMLKEERAVFAKSMRPELRDEDIARLCGVDRRSLYRWERYQRLKPRLTDRLNPKQRGFSNPDDPNG